MAGVFVSHASADKDVVEKVVFFLLSRGVPVWYDSIELGLGNRLIQSIRKGVDRSTCFLVLLSRNALSSAWVAQEIELALRHERELNRDFLLIGLLDDLEVPEAVADRVYVRLVGDEFLAGCDRIRDHLLSQNVGMRDIPLRQQIVPVAFRRGVHLEKFELARKLEAIRSAFGPDALAGLGTENFRCFLEFKLRDLEKRAQAAALSQDDDPNLPDEESHAAKLILERVAGEKRSILDGIRLIAQNWPADSAAEASYWFAKNLRHGIICALSRKAFAKPDEEPEIETVFGAGCRVTNELSGCSTSRVPSRSGSSMRKAMSDCSGLGSTPTRLVAAICWTRSGSRGHCTTTSWPTPPSLSSSCPPCCGTIIAGCAMSYAGTSAIASWNGSSSH